ncbi:hypothetical protein PRZ48_005017 [Zasmidium cellare]|uniref:DRBM domain-containing protein n=1 Tax=Zasmidium cellare TaxID=395010 RepID=A0ABR0ERE3_ZASCE|nr:hypothetical protein PRZ48_005017 [Zasmidium cellare]
MGGHHDDNPPASSQLSAIDELLALLQDNDQPIPTSSAPSRDGGEDGPGTCVGAGSTAAADPRRHAGRPHVSIRAEAPRVKNVGTPSRTGEYPRPPSALYSRGGIEFCKATPPSPPGSAEAAPQSKLGSSQHYSRALQSSLATSAQKTRARLEAYGVENFLPPSGQMAHFSNNVVPVLQDTDMENSAFGFGSNSMLDLVPIEAWEKANPYTPPPAKTTSPPPARNLVPVRLERNKGKDAQLFNTECQRRGLMHDFQYEEVAKGCYDVTLFVNGQKIDRAGPYVSQRDAKEAICRLAMGKLGTLAQMGFKNVEVGGGGGKKRRSSEFQNDLPLLPDGLEDEKWNDIINTYAQQHQLEYPDYVFEDGEPSGFKCTLTFVDSPLPSFGSSLGPFKRKDIAKKAAAMEGVTWLRAQGKLSETTSKRRKSLPQQIDHPIAAVDTDDTQNRTGETVAQQVYELARRLGFSQPKFNIVRREANFVDESATFAEKDIRYEPRLAGVHGQVRRVFGKKVAHEECCRLVLQFLKEIQRSRMG